MSLVIAASLGYVGFWWLEARDRKIGMLPVPPVNGSSEITINNVQFDGNDRHGRPYSITAAMASHATGNDRLVQLTNPLADIVTSKGTYVALTADDGILDRDADVITLHGDVTLFHDTGLSFQTDSATIDLGARTTQGDDVVEGQNGKGELVSQGFRVRDDGATIEFTGNAYLKIYAKREDER